MDMLFIFLLWHGLAKLKMHTETSVNIFERVTVQLGCAVRTFERKCRKIDTRELPKEAACRGRRKAAAAAKKGDTGAATSTKGGPEKVSRKQKMLNLITFKLHNLGHYPAWIRWMGTTDNYSTQVVSLISPRTSMSIY